MPGIFGESKDELATSLAALVLYDGGAEITSDNISTLLAGANIKVAPYWPGLFAGFLKDGRAEKLVFSLGGGGGASASVAPVSADSGSGADAGAKKEEEKKPKEEVVDALEGGMDMFGGGGGGGDY